MRMRLILIYLRRLLILKRLLKILKVWIMVTELVQHLEALSISELPGGAKPNLNVVVAMQ